MGSQRTQRTHIIDVRVDPTTYDRAATLITAWAREGASKYVCIATVNNVMESYGSAEFRSVMNGADLVTPDGMPLVWGLRLLGHKTATRVYGPDLTEILLERAASESLPVGFYGGSTHVLQRLLDAVTERFPKLAVTYQLSPPFRPLTPEEDDQVVDTINRSGARILFIGLSTPKQERWMAAHKGRIQAVMVGVGAAFDFLSGTKLQAPRWMMRIGMEWFFRLVTEPRRLWKRYLKHNPRFVVLFALQLLGLKKFPSG
jgi:N-acetylglucosaminyldiphosphoundecaprenol N-acetyl-beta-D-mannosaminyltransferase